MAERRLRIERADLATLEVPDEGGGFIEYPVRFGSNLDVDVMAEILDLSLEFRRFGMRRPEKVAEWTRRAKALVMTVIRENTPDAPDLRLNPNELFQVLAFIGGSENVPQTVAEALADGLDETTAGETTTDPTTSQKRSRSRRSRSERRTAGVPDTGEVSDGETSASISPITTGD